MPRAVLLDLEPGTMEAVSFFKPFFFNVDQQSDKIN